MSGAICGPQPDVLPLWLTAAQKAAYHELAARWNGRVSEPRRMVGGDGAALVECRYDCGDNHIHPGGGSMWVGIEPDGYTHS